MRAAACHLFGLMGVLLVGAAAAQEQVHSGRPLWQAFTTQDTRGAAVTHDAILTPDGLVYAANDAGLLRFDGVRWRLIPAGPGRLPLRQLILADDGSLFAATPDGLGTFTPDSSGQLVWMDVPLGEEGVSQGPITLYALDGIVVDTNGPVLRLTDGAFTTLSDGGPVRLAFQTPAGSVVDLGDRLVLINENAQTDVEAPPGWQSLSPLTVLSADDNSLVLVTRRSGLFNLELSGATLTASPLWVSLPVAIESAELTSATRLEDGGYVLGTRSGTIVRVNSDGTTHWHINAANGFHAGAVRAIVVTSPDTALAFFDGGAAYVDTQADIRVWDVLSGLTSPPADIATDGPVTFAATRSGLFRSLSSHRMRLVPEAGPDSISSMTKFPRSSMRGHFSLLITREDGLFDFFNDQLTPVLAETVSALHIARTRPSRVISATDSDLVILDFADGVWNETGRMALPPQAVVTDMAEGPDGNLFLVTTDGRALLYAPETWLSDTVDPNPRPLIEQRIPRRPDPDASPFLTSYADTQRAFIHGAPLVWDARRSAFVSDIPLAAWMSDSSSEIDLHWYAGAQGPSGLWLATSRGFVEVEDGTVTDVQIPRLATSYYGAIAERVERARVYFATTAGLFSRELTAAETSGPSRAAIQLVLSGWSSDAGKTRQVTAQRPELIRVPRGAPLTLDLGAISWPRACGNDINAILFEQPNAPPQSVAMTGACQVDLRDVTQRSGQQDLILTALSSEKPVSTPLTLRVNVVSPWHAQSWIPLGAAVMMAFASVFAMGQRNNTGMDFLFRTTGLSALFFLIQVVALEISYVSPPGSVGEMLRGIAIIVCGAALIIGFNLTLNKVRPP